MQIAVSKRKYMAVLLNIRANVYRQDREQLKRDLKTIRKILTLVDEPSESMLRVEQALTKQYIKKF